MASNREDKQGNDSDCQIVAYLGNAGETMSSSENESDDYLKRKKKLKVHHRPNEKSKGYESSDSSSSVEVICVKSNVNDQNIESENESISPNQMGSKQVLDMIFQEEMKEYSDEEKQVRIV